MRAMDFLVGGEERRVDCWEGRMGMLYIEPVADTRIQSSLQHPAEHPD